MIQKLLWFYGPAALTLLALLGVVSSWVGIAAFAFFFVFVRLSLFILVRGTMLLGQQVKNLGLQLQEELLKKL